MKVTNTFDTNPVKAKVRMAIKIFGEAEAKRMEGEAKADAPWTDRTSNARNSITGSFRWEEAKAIITLSGNMDYSVYLELAMEEKYAVLIPTIRRNTPAILNGYRKLVK